MVTMTLRSPSPQLLQPSFHSHSLGASVKLHCSTLPINLHFGSKYESVRPLICCSSSAPSRRTLRKPEFELGSGLEESITDSIRKILPEPVIALGSGLEVSIADVGHCVSIRDVEITMESKDDDKMQVRVDVPGQETRIVFEKTLRNLARSAPPIPGFRREKGGKTCKVPKDFLRHILGEDQVTEFVIQEIVRLTLADYVDKENLTVKDYKVNTTQTPEELKSVFVLGNDFGFNATLELQQSTLELETDDYRILDNIVKLSGDGRELTRRKWKTFNFIKDSHGLGPAGSRVLETKTRMHPKHVRERVRIPRSKGVQHTRKPAPARRRGGGNLVQFG